MTQTKSLGGQLIKADRTPGVESAVTTKDMGNNLLTGLSRYTNLNLYSAQSQEAL